MPAFVIDHMPAELLDRIQDLARVRRQTAADTALEVLAGALPAANSQPAPLPSQPFATDDVLEAISLPWPAGDIVAAETVPTPLPTLRDLPTNE